MYVLTFLVGFLNNDKFLVKTFSLLITDISKVFSEFFKVTKQEVSINAHVIAMQYKERKQFINSCHVIICYFVPKETVHQVNESLPGLFLNGGHLSMKSLSPINFENC